MSGGPTAPRPVVCLHGWTMRGALFDDLAARLGPGAQVLAPDLPGHGGTAFEEPWLDAAASLVARTIGATGRDDVLLLGWSMGAAVAWHYLDRFGADRVAGLVTVDMSPKLVNEGAWELGLLGQEPGRVARTTAEIHTGWPRAAEKIATTMFAEKTGAPGFSRDDALRQVLSGDPVAMARVWDAMIAMDLRAAARKVPCPWIVAHGARSRVYPAATAAWLADSAPQARPARFGQSGHSPHLEEPDAFARLILDFSDELEAHPPRRARLR